MYHPLHAIGLTILLLLPGSGLLADGPMEPSEARISSAIANLDAPMTIESRPAATAGPGTSPEVTYLEPSPERDRVSNSPPLEEARRLIRDGQWQQARDLLYSAVAVAPKDAALRYKLAELLWAFYKDRNEGEAAAIEAADQALAAALLALEGGAFESKYLDLVSRTALLTRSTDAVQTLFEKAVAAHPTALNHLLYARTLASLNEAGAEEHYMEALALSPEIALTDYSEWLLDQGREQDVLQLADIYPETHDYYLYFVRGVASERLGDQIAARDAYDKYVRASEVVPAPTRFQIRGSSLQSTITFQDSALAPVSGIAPTPEAVTTSQAITGLSYLVSGEAEGESTGGRRAAGWVVRNRVLRGAVASQGEFCPGAYNTGTALADKYKSVMCASDQFDGMCDFWCANQSTTSCSAVSGTATVANDIYYGYQPDPVGGHCPGGRSSGSSSYCSSSVCTGHTDTYRLAGSLFNYGLSGSCPADPPGSGCTVTTSAGKICGDGGLDNCFYRHEWYSIFSSYTPYTCTIASQGGGCISGNLTVSGGTFYGHLEGPEGLTSAYNFQLYLQKLNGSTWSNVASSTRAGTIEDIKYTASSGTYRWRVVASVGSGFFRLAAGNP